MSFLTDASKSVLGSKTIWGAVIAAVPLAQGEIANALATPGLPHWLVVSLGVVGFSLTLVGRISATHTITSVLPQSNVSV